MAFEPRVNTIKQRQNDNGNSENLVHSFWTFDIWHTYILCGLYCVDTLFTNVYLPGLKVCNMFQISLKMLMKHVCLYYIRNRGQWIIGKFIDWHKFNIYSTSLHKKNKLQWLFSVEPKDASGTRTIKTKLGYSFI